MCRPRAERHSRQSQHGRSAFTKVIGFPGVHVIHPLHMAWMRSSHGNERRSKERNYGILPYCLFERIRMTPLAPLKPERTKVVWQTA
jgi:hypothetical protein